MRADPEITTVHVEGRIVEEPDTCEGCGANDCARYCRVSCGAQAPFVLWLCRDCMRSESKISTAYAISDRFYPGAAERMAERW